MTDLSRQTVERLAEVYYTTRIKIRMGEAAAAEAWAELDQPGRAREIECATAALAELESPRKVPMPEEVSAAVMFVMGGAHRDHCPPTCINTVSCHKQRTTASLLERQARALAEAQRGIEEFMTSGVGKDGEGVPPWCTRSLEMLKAILAKSKERS